MESTHAKEETIESLNLKIDTLLKEQQTQLALLNKSNGRGIALREENMMLLASPDIQMKMAEMNYHLAVAQKLIASNAFPNITPEQAYVIIKAGVEMNMPEVESLNALYIVNGRISFHSKGLSGRLTQFGYKINFSDESELGVTVTVTHQKDGFKETEIVKRVDKIFNNSNAIKIDAKNKMRFHGIRQIANFHLAHLLGSAGIWDSDDIRVEASAEYNLDDLKELYELKKESVSPDQQIGIERILKSNEIASFKKVNDYLKKL